MKAWHYIAIAGVLGIVVLIVCKYVRRAPGEPIAGAGDKLGTNTLGSAGAPPLPNVSMAVPNTAAYYTFTQTNSFGRRSL